MNIGDRVYAHATIGGIVINGIHGRILGEKSCGCYPIQFDIDVHGHSCDGLGVNGRCFWVKEDNITVVQYVDSSLKAGDRVEVRGVMGTMTFDCELGIVVGFSNHTGRPLVEFDKTKTGYHSGVDNVRGKKNHCFFVNKELIKKIKSVSVVMF